MKISVVIPCYNGEKFISDAIRSVNNQTYLPIEIVVVDDGSTDKSVAIVKKLQKSSKVPIVLKKQDNGGVSVARNVGINIAAGEWVSFLDVDDIFLPNNLAKKVEAANRLKMSTGLICNDYFFNEESEDTRKHKKSPIAHFDHDRLILGRDYQRSLIKDYYIGTATAMMFSRMEAIKIGGFDSMMKHSEDFDFVLRFTCENNVLILSEPLAIKRVHDANLSNNKELYFYSHRFSCMKNLQYEDAYCRGAFSEATRDLLKANYDSFTIGFCNEVYERKWSQGLSNYLEALIFPKTFLGFLKITVGLLKKLIRTISFGMIKGNPKKKL
ncbi:glycosyltransferase family 2 protein [Alteromonas sp. A081]|uniref:glycosyltransferase family 2 protein n=1 Tax=Alteromonas sp. A081 TaxID=3410269 RepID=UPI003B981FDD